ncbi:ATP-binding protein [Candidatus Methylomirabilis sp.]|uniref:hybrid sensor histidine kinase/response regulator n=1 Tax=Candidatus Methylomirabilis sp. TaxID=2032687 RepID=UPI002A64E1CF|nr:ATP-binding protein [Candidatus Methylomirabilis sp.]
MERRILVVEDSPTQAERVRFLLEREGYRVEMATNGCEGLRHVQSAPPDLIVSDVVMPEMDGYAFCRAVKSREQYKRIPFVLLTERKTPLDILKGLEHGADNFITKPFEDDYLLERIRRIFEHLEFRKGGQLDVEVAVRAGGREIIISPDKQQIIELLFASFEEICALNGQLAESKKSLEHYSKDLEAKVLERTRQLQRQREMLQALYQASLEIQAPLELQERLDRLLQTAQTVLEMDRVNILLADLEGRELRAVASLGMEGPLAAIRVPIGPAGGALAAAYRTQQMITSDGRASLPELLRLQPPYDQIEAFSSPVFAIAPLVVQGQAIGVFAGDRKYSLRPLDPSTQELFQLFATQAALAIEHVRLYEVQCMAAVQLEAKVEERTRELNEALRRVEMMSQHKSQFLANMSHELRTPLNSILGFAELLQDPQFEPITTKQGRYLSHIHSSGQHLLALINDLLDLSKVEAGRLELRPETFLLAEALTAALESFRVQVDTKGVTLTVHADQAPTSLVADPLRVKQMLYNLISNAVKFTPAGGAITVTAKMVSRSESGVSSSQPETLDSGDFVDIAVSDTGIGIKAEDLSRLFQEFTQLDSSFAKPQQGTGLGLALTKRLVELHGGTITVTSPGQGQGSTFTITLPLRPPGTEGRIQAHEA